MTNKARAGRQIACRTFGTGPRQALAIHCSLAHSGAWSGVAAALAEDMTITAFDMPGHGRSADWDGNGDYLQAVAAIAATFLTEPVDLIGHSAGGIAALQLAQAAAPGMIRSLTLIEPVLFAALRGSTVWAESVAQNRPHVEAAARGDWESATQAFMDVWGSGVPWEDMDPRQRAYLVKRMPLIGACRPGSDDDSGRVLAEDRLEALDLPVMLIGGTESPGTVHAINEALAARMADVGVAAVEGAGHMSPVTHPAQVAGLIEVNVTRG